MATARLLRRFHDASASFVLPEPAIWRQHDCPGLGPGEIVCHGDLGPHDTVYRDRRPVAFIDWDGIRPNDPLLEFGTAAWKFVPLGDDHYFEASDFPETPDLAHRLTVFAGEYGVADLDELIWVAGWSLAGRAARSEARRRRRHPILHEDCEAGCVVRASTAVALVAALIIVGACRDDSTDTVAPGGPGSPSSESQAPAEDWKVTAVIESGGDGVGLYYIGGHRLTADGSGYESTSECFRVELDGTRTRIADPPIELGIGSVASGVATEESVFVMLRDCLPGGVPTSAGFMCRGSGELRFLRYDVARGEWESLGVPSELVEAESRSRVGRIPGQVIEGGRVFFGVPSTNYDGAVSHQIAVFDIATETWSMLLDDTEDLPGTCTDGSSVFHFDAQQLLDIFARHRLSHLTRTA